MKKIGLFYGPILGSCEKVARTLWKMIGEDKCDIKAVRYCDKSDLDKYDNIIFGLSTVGAETWQADKFQSGWFTFMNELEKADLEGKVIAIFGLGDQVRYPYHFADAMGEVYEKIKEKGLDTIGKWPQEGYQFNESKAFVDDMFVGLPIDEEFQADMTEERLEKWLELISPHFK